MKNVFIHTGSSPPSYPGVLDANSNLMFGIQWGDHFGENVRIVSASWEGGGLTVSDEQIDANLTAASLADAQEGARYLVRCSVVTDDGQTDTKSFYVNGGVS